MIFFLQSIQEDTEEKEALIRKVRQMQAKEAEMKIQISKFSDSDPEIIKSIIKKAEVSLWFFRPISSAIH